MLIEFPPHDDGREYQIKEASYKNIINPKTNRFIAENGISYRSMYKIVQEILKEKNKKNPQLVLNCQVGELKLSPKFLYNIFYKNQESVNNHILKNLQLVEVTYSLSL